MVIQKIVQEIIKYGTKYGRVETSLFNKLYGPYGRFPGVRNYKTAGRGIRHGLAGGATVGSFIGNGGDDSGDASIFRPQTSTPYQARKGQQFRYNSKYNSKYSRYSGRRRSCSCKYKRGGNRFKGKRYLPKGRSRRY